MRDRRVTAIYFSPTGGTKACVEAVAGALAADHQVINLTDPSVRAQEYAFTEKDLVIVGAPVYAGRLPQIEGGIFDRLRGAGTPAVFCVSYGNRAFEDALLEEKELLEARGFTGVAAGAFIAPHTFSHKIGAGRPDKADRKVLADFAKRIAARLGEGTWPPLQAPGNHPYQPCREPAPRTYYPTGDESCIGCGACAGVCPTGAVSGEDLRATDPNKCIDCLACVNICPTGARVVRQPEYQGVVQWVESALTARQEPELFF